MPFSPQLFQTFCVHRSPVTKVKFNEKCTIQYIHFSLSLDYSFRAAFNKVKLFEIYYYKLYLIISVCASNNHVRTWNVTRFRGMISTQPGYIALN